MRNPGSDCTCAADTCPAALAARPSPEQHRIAQEIENNGALYCHGLIAAQALSERELLQLMSSQCVQQQILAATARPRSSARRKAALNLVAIAAQSARLLALELEEAAGRTFASLDLARPGSTSEPA